MQASLGYEFLLDMAFFNNFSLPDLLKLILKEVTSLLPICVQSEDMTF